ncbi:hypothetical protein K469DRAFT_693044 [Zopfia rhizophila CBS 207.26]|uniref:Uncharacterized protein n=1 Tax=Zopfia rhizophila CBS 207.26 TaxID=1314779 RepID=A0A6A6EP61_9PEZI|nr:hypothetical protein K469DRAFT_693044 [Zopfia rhizophila CBS 207.26]
MHKRQYKDVLKEKVRAMYVGVPRFFEAFLGGVAGLEPAAKSREVQKISTQKWGSRIKRDTQQDGYNTLTKPIAVLLKGAAHRVVREVCAAGKRIRLLLLEGIEDKRMWGTTFELIWAFYEAHADLF